MAIEAAALEACRVVDGGNRIVMQVTDSAGNPAEMTLSAADASSVAMTLPRLLRMALRSRFRDDTPRYVLPRDAWKLEAGEDDGALSLTMATGGGFEASFALEDRCVDWLGGALSAPCQEPMRAPTRVRN